MLQIVFNGRGVSNNWMRNSWILFCTSIGGGGKSQGRCRRAKRTLASPRRDHHFGVVTVTSGKWCGIGAVGIGSNLEKRERAAKIAPAATIVDDYGPRGASARTVRVKCPRGTFARTVRADGPRGRSAQSARADGPRRRSARIVRADGPRGRSMRT